MSCRRTSCRRNPLGPIRVGPGIDLIAILRAMGVEARIDPMDKPIQIGPIKVEPMRQPIGGVLFVKCHYGQSKKRRGDPAGL